MEITEVMAEGAMLTTIIDFHTVDKTVSMTEDTAIINHQIDGSKSQKKYSKINITMCVPFSVFQDIMSNIVMKQYTNLRTWKNLLESAYCNRKTQPQILQN